ncbi:AB hydrolase-1 domain-containing protein [Lachancea thermotolerans]
MSSVIHPVCHIIEVEEGTKLWYWEAGAKTRPAILLLHGYPTSSNMFRDLIPLIAPHFHVLAPDLPGFGFTTVNDNYTYTFDNLAETILKFTKAIGLSKYIIYIFDYGLPVGLRLALREPSSVIGLIVQNGNAYEEGLDNRFWGPLKEYWKTDEGNPQLVNQLKSFVDDPNNISRQYYEGVSNSESIDPSGYTLGIALLRRPEQSNIQVKLFYDYQKNVELYPKFQEYLKTTDFPVLIVWGKNDAIFTCDGAEAYKRDAKNAIVKFFDTGHFALETHAVEISNQIIQHYGTSKSS